MLKHGLIATTLLVSVTLLSARAGLAQDADGQGATALEAISVLGTGLPISVFESPSSVTVIDQGQLRRIAPQSVGSFLESVPGVIIGEQGIQRIQIRGEAERRVLIKIDGQALTDHTTYGQPVLVDPLNIERIEVIRGPHPRSRGRAPLAEWSTSSQSATPRSKRLRSRSARAISEARTDTAPAVLLAERSDPSTAASRAAPPSSRTERARIASSSAPAAARTASRCIWAARLIRTNTSCSRPSAMISPQRSLPMTRTSRLICPIEILRNTRRSTRGGP